jgi:hypothetical protein
MNDIAKAGSSPVSTEVRTPAYGNFDINTDKLHHLLLFMGVGEKGFEREVFEDLKNVRARIASIRRGIGDDVHAVIPSGDLRPALDSVIERINAHYSGRKVVVEWLPVMMVTTVEAYLLDVLAYAAGIDPSLMERSEQSVSYAELTTASSLEEVMTELRYRWAKNFIEKGGPYSWIARLTKMGARTYRPETAQEMEMLWGIRHLIVHTAGVATADFTRRYPHLGIQVGENVRVDLGSLRNWFKHIYHFVDVTDTYFIQRCRL